MSHQSSLIADNIEQYLHEHENKDLLRFITCGSVDDGKSTLVGRLLHDSKMIFDDQPAALSRDSKKSGTTGDAVDLARSEERRGGKEGRWRCQLDPGKEERTWLERGFEAALDIASGQIHVA